MTHRLKSLMFATAVVALATRLSAQVDEALKATKVQDYVLVAAPSGNSKALRYAVDAAGPGAPLHSILPDHIFAASNRREVNVRLVFVNPLTYSWTMTVASQREPLLSSIEQFFNSAGQLFALLGGGPPTATSEVKSTGPVTTAQTASVAAGGTRTDSKAEGVGQYIDPSLLQWELLTTSGGARNDATTSLLKDAKIPSSEFDAMLFSDAAAKDIKVVVTAAEFRALARAAVTDLLSANSMDALRVSLERARSRLTLLQSANVKARQQGEAMIGLAVRFEKAWAEDANVADKTILGYSARVFRSAVVRSATIIEAREQLAKQLSGVLDELARKIPPGSSDQVFDLGDVPVQSGERSMVTVTLTQRKVEVTSDGVRSNDGDVTRATFAVMEKQSWLTEFTQGIAYADVAFPQYKTNADSTNPSAHVVADAGSNRPRAMAIAMFNLLPNFGASGVTQPILQLGLGVTTEAPLIAAGLGFRFSKPSHFSIVFGAALPLIQELRTLKLGQRVAGEAELKKDIGRGFSQRASFYIGLQR